MNSRNPLADRTLVICLTLLITVVIVGFVVLSVFGQSMVAFRAVSLIGTGCIALITVTGVGSKLLGVQRGVDDLSNGTLDARIQAGAVAAIADFVGGFMPVVTTHMTDTEAQAARVADSAGVELHGALTSWTETHGPLLTATPPNASQT